MFLGRAPNKVPNNVQLANHATIPVMWHALALIVMWLLGFFFGVIAAVAYMCWQAASADPDSH